MKFKKYYKIGWDYKIFKPSQILVPVRFMKKQKINRKMPFLMKMYALLKNRKQKFWYYFIHTW